MNDIINKVVGILVGAVLVGAVIGTAIGSVVNVNTSGWDAPTIAIYGLVGIFIALAIALMFIKIATK